MSNYIKFKNSENFGTLAKSYKIVEAEERQLLKVYHTHTLCVRGWHSWYSWYIYVRSLTANQKVPGSMALAWSRVGTVGTYVRSLTANKKVPGSVPDLVEG